MSPSNVADNGKTDIRATEAQTARWMVRLHGRHVSRATEREFDEWLNGAAERRECYVRGESALAMARSLKDDPDLKPAIEECARISSAGTPRTGHLRETPLRRFWLGFATAAGAAASLAGVYVFLSDDHRSAGSAPASYRTMIGERRSLVLADHSTVTLNTDTALSVSISDRVRRVDLQRGEAYFKVAHDGSRPFEVWAGGGLVRAAGTQFSVEVLSDRVTVSAIEGAVSVILRPKETTAGESPQGLLLEADRSISFAAGGAIFPERAADVRRIAAWRDGKLIFDRMPLADAIADYNRYTTRKVEIGTPQIGRLPVSAELDIGDDDSLRTLLRETLSLRVVDQPGSVLLLDSGARGSIPTSIEGSGSRK